jgi:penicillin-binding protein 2
VILPPVDPNIEPQLSDKPPLRDDTHFAASKIAIFQYAAVIIFLFLISGFWKLQVQNPQFYDERAQQNSIKSIPLLAPRGRILDRDGRVIVDNHSSFTLILARESLKEEHLRPIAQGLDLDLIDLQNRVRRFRLQPKYVPIVIKEECTPADLAFVDSHRDFFPELVLIQAQRRLYPQNGMMAHVIGYTGEISEQELDSPEFAKNNPGDVVGKFGIEKEYNEWLTGVDGQRQVVVDNRGQVREVLKTKPFVPGKDLRLSIDLDLQAVAELAMDGGVKELGVDHKNGAVVALDPRTGEILAMVSRPTFDPNKFAVRIKPKDWKEINENPDKPLMNKAIQAQQAPGSTFKPFTALAGLESGSIDDKFTVHCSGGVSLYGHYYHCWVKTGHGAMSLHNGIVHSCDSYFYTIGNKMGIDNISFYGDLVGFGHPTGIDLPHENEGVMPSQKWKLRTQRQKWYAGETPSVAIGQGALTVTPLQLARAIGGLAIGGVWHTPHLLETPIQPDKVVQWTLNPENVQKIIDGMYGVVNEGGGTGGRARLSTVEVCGKTGSAQLASNDFLKGTTAGRAKNMRDNAWFEGFAPRSAPEIVVVCLFEHGEHGQYAAPVVRDVIKAYFDKKARLAAMQQEKNAIQARMAAMGSIGIPGGQAPAASQAPRPAAPPQPVKVEAAVIDATVPAAAAPGAPVRTPRPASADPHTAGPSSKAAPQQERPEN